MWKWITALSAGAVNAGLVAALSFKALCPPDSKAFALVSIAAAMVGFVAPFLESPLKGSDK